VIKTFIINIPYNKIADKSIVLRLITDVVMILKKTGGWKIVLITNGDVIAHCSSATFIMSYRLYSYIPIVLD
jgi:hypothetical protein